MEIMSAAPEPITSSITPGLRIPPTTLKGRDVAFRTMRASGRKQASFSSDVIPKRFFFLQDISCE
jgi:hypothetical protein